MRYEGYLDWNDGWTAFGWAFDRERPDDAVEVDFTIDTKPIGTLKADEHRPDLRRHGNAMHGFSFRLPLDANKAGALSAKVRNTDFMLPGSPMPRKLPRQSIGRIAGDIVNQCNLRCPFCIVDYTNFGRLKLMRRDTFERALTVLPMIPLGSFWLSCLHEPTMHPDFIGFIEAVPNELRDRISFTTNLSMRLSADFLDCLANSGVHEIRVSFDTRQPEIFAELRAKGRYALFERNLADFSLALQSSRRRPLLHFITMAFKDNYGEIADLIRFGQNIGADSHEVRYISYVPHVAHWGRAHILNMDEWNELESALAPLAACTKLYTAGPKPGTLAQFEEEQGLAEYVARENFFGGGTESMRDVPDPIAIGRKMPDEPLLLRLRWDGVMVSERISEDQFCVDLNRIERPAEYFDNMRLGAFGSAVGTSCCR